MTLSVFSEIGPLKEVLVHAPGPEVDNMPPSMMGEFLFDDIIYGPGARREHAYFRAILEKLGVVVRDTGLLLEEALAGSGAEARGLLIGEVRQLEGLDEETVEILQGLPAPELANTLVHGLRQPPEVMHPGNLFRLAPLPNLLFSRDAQVVVGDQILICAMSRRARRREPVLSRFVIEHHPRFRDESVLLDFSRTRSALSIEAGFAPSFEGGDFLIFKEGVAVVGISERTTETAVESLAKRLRKIGTFHTLIMVPMPRVREAMHLDTIFTRLSRDECLVYEPMVISGRHETLSVISIDLGKSNDWGSRQPSLLDALKQVGVDLKPIPCGKRGDYIQQSREQWTDGANSFAISPGVVMTYRRNSSTAEELSQNGYEVLKASDMKFSDDGRCLHGFSPGKKYAILVAGDELSRARGGPRCMTMPLVSERI